MLTASQWFMSFLMLRAIDFAIAEKLFVRERFSWLPPNAPKDYSTQLKGALLNAFDLTFNARGIGWKLHLAHPLYHPPRRRNHNNLSSHQASS